MEELRSTEILEQEIHAESKKEAEKILSAARREAEKIISEVGPRLEVAKAERDKFYAAKVAKCEKDLRASVPLECQRFLVSFVSQGVDSALNEYFKKLSQEERLEISLKPISAKKEFFSSKKFRAKVYGFDLDLARASLEKNLKNNLLSAEKIDFALSGEEAQSGIEFHEGVILESEDKGVKCRLTLGEAVSELKDKHYGELAEKLFGDNLRKI